MKTRTLSFVAAAVAACIGSFSAHADTPWLLNKSPQYMQPGEFLTLTSPDGKWQFYCAPTHEYDSDYTVRFGDDDPTSNFGGYAQIPQIAIASDYEYSTGNWWYNCEVEDFTDGKQVGAYIKGSGVLRLPTHAKDPQTEEILTVGVAEWSLMGYEKKTDVITKVIIPADYDKAFGAGSSLKLAQGYEVEVGNSVYYSKDGVLYRLAAKRPPHDESTGDTGDELMQFPTSKKGSFTIPDSVTMVRNGAFDRAALSELVIGPGLETFGCDNDCDINAVTINGNPRFKCVNGVLADKGGKRAVLVLWPQFKGKDIVVSPEIEEVDECMFSCGAAKSIKFSSEHLVLGCWVFDQLTLTGDLDFSEVGYLEIGGPLSGEVIPRIILPENVKFPSLSGEEGVIDLGEDFEKSIDIIWPTSKPQADSGLAEVWYESENPKVTATLHVRANAGYWPDSVGNAKVKKDVYVVDFGGTARYVLAGATLGTLPVPVMAGYQFDGWYTASGTKAAASMKITADTTFYADWSAAIVPSVMAGCEAMGKVSGGGVVAQGKTTTLKATANKGYAFDGWYDAYGNPLPGDYLSLSYVYMSTGEAASIVAKFAKDILTLDIDPVYPAAGDGSFSLYLGGCVKSISTPKLAVSGLPAGLKYDAKTMTISGNATKPGVYTVTVKATNASVTGKDAKTATFTINVPNSDAFGPTFADTPAPIKLNQAVPFEHVFSLAAGYDGYTVAVSGLPAGLKFDKNSGTVSGRPTKPGTYTVTLTATKKGAATQVAVLTFVVDPLPEWLVGTFTGYSTGVDYVPESIPDDYIPEHYYNDLVSVVIAKDGKLSKTCRYVDGVWKTKMDGDGQYTSAKLASTKVVTDKVASNVEISRIDDVGNYVYEFLDDGVPSVAVVSPVVYDEGSGAKYGRIVCKCFGRQVEDDWEEEDVLTQSLYERKPVVEGLFSYVGTRTIEFTDYEATEDIPGTLTLKYGKNGAVAATFKTEYNGKAITRPVVAQPVSVEGKVYVCFVSAEYYDANFDMEIIGALALDVDEEGNVTNIEELPQFKVE